MNIPNALTLSRLVMAALLTAVVSFGFRGAYTAALVLFLVAAVTDILDGRLARRVYGVTDFGKLMDPLADKIMVCAALVCFVGIKLRPDGPSLVPAWIVIAILSREFLVTGLRLLAANKGRVISAGNWGKHKTVWQMSMIALLLAGLAVRNDWAPAVCRDGRLDAPLQWVSYGLSALVLLLTVVSGWKYLAGHLDLFAETKGSA